MRIPKEEREISAGGYVYSHDGTKAERMKVYVSDYGYMLKFDRFCTENPEEWHLEKVDKVDGDVVAKHYTCPTSCISFRRGRNRLTDENKKALAELGRANLGKFHAESSAE